jgi:DNA-binding MarR family transcriptional regulator
MSRYGRDDSPDEINDSTARRPAGPQSGQQTSDARGQGGGSGTTDNQTLPHDIPNHERSGSPRNPEPRELDPRRERHYDLRDSEVQTLADIGAFRAIKTEDLVEYRYGGDARQARRDLKHLVEQGLVQRRTTYPARNVYVALTRSGHRYIEHHRPANAAAHQVFYHGFAKRREARHDAGIYRLYQRESERITRAGGKVNRVILDFELKASVNRELAKVHSLPAEERFSRRQEIAQAHGLAVVGRKIPLPDLRLEYETLDLQQTKVDLELVSGEYRQGQIAEKARAGFTLYAATANAARLRPAMADPEIMQEILSL